MPNEADTKDGAENSDEPYSRDEIEGVGDELPKRGPICWKCKNHIPRFRDLSSDDEERLRKLIDEGQRVVATKELRLITKCKISWAKLWVLHAGRPHPADPVAPCPYCGKPLVTAKARQCRYCLMDWHDPNNLKKLG